MNNLKQDLLSIGMTEEEIIVYLATLQPNNETVLKISQNTDIPRTTVYLLIESLLQKHFIKEITEGKKKHYIPAPPEQIVSYATTRKQQLMEVIANLQKNIPSIRALYNFYHGKPIIQYYEGKREIQKLLVSIIEDDELCIHILSDASTELLSEEIGFFRSEIKKKMLPTREIVSDSLTEKHFMKTYANARNQVRYISEQYKTNVDYLLYAAGFIMITYKNNIPVAVCIEDKHIVEFENIRFNLLWDNHVLHADNK